MRKDFDKAAKPPRTIQKEFEKAAKPKRRIFREFERAAKPPPRVGKEFGKAARPPDKDQEQDRKRTGGEGQRRDIADQKQDMGISKEGADKARQDRRKRTYSAFRDLANEVTRDRGRERTIKRKPPRPPENGEQKLVLKYVLDDIWRLRHNWI